MSCFALTCLFKLDNNTHYNTGETEYIHINVYFVSTRSLPRIIKFDEGEWRPPTIFQVNECYFTEFVEEILDIFRSYIRWQITHINPTFVSAAVRHIQFIGSMFLRAGSYVKEDTNSSFTNLKVS